MLPVITGGVTLAEMKAQKDGVICPISHNIRNRSFLM